jgi:hypothetical protein
MTIRVLGLPSSKFDMKTLLRSKLRRLWKQACHGFQDVTGSFA